MHDDVGQHELQRFLAVTAKRQSLLRRRRRFDPIAPALEDLPYDRQQRLVVVNDQDCRLRGLRVRTGGRFVGLPGGHRRFHRGKQDRNGRSPRFAGLNGDSADGLRDEA